MSAAPDHDLSVSAQLAVVSTTLGALQRSVEQSLERQDRRGEDHARRIRLIEDRQIREDERRAAAGEEDERQRFALTRWQAIMGGVLGGAVLVLNIIALVSG